MKRIASILGALLLAATSIMAAPQIKAEEEDTVIHSIEILASFPSGGEEVPDPTTFDGLVITPDHPRYNHVGQVYVADTSARYELDGYSYFTSTSAFIFDPLFVTDSIYELEILLWPKKGYIWDNIDSLLARSTINGQPVDCHAENGAMIFLNVYFKAEAPGKPLEGRFTIDDTGTQVQFGKGNLQYQPSTRTWRPSGYQDLVIGDNNSRAAADYGGWIDLFGWGASGYNGLEPYMTSSNPAEYCMLSSLAGTDYDWVKVAADSMHQTGTWRSLTQWEWEWLLNDRPNYDELRGLAQIDSTKGLLLLPDNWDRDARPLNKEIDNPCTVLTGREWFEWQNLGAVFLPAAGRREGTDVIDVNEAACYWSASDDFENDAMLIGFSKNMDGLYGKSKTLGLAVRATRIVENEPTGWNGERREAKGESRKILRNGQLLIKRDGKTYNAQGVEVNE